MISSLHGKVESLGSDCAVVNVNGVGFQVFMPTSTLSAIGAVGKEVQLFTHLYSARTTSPSTASLLRKNSRFSSCSSASTASGRAWRWRCFPE